jgi:carbon storage regulator CsrA
MLVLTRRIGEEIVIGDNIRVVVLRAKGDRIQIGVQAPPAIAVDRAEIHERRRLSLTQRDEHSATQSGFFRRATFVDGSRTAEPPPEVLAESTQLDEPFA